jgi:hypothetical protein
MHFNTFFFNDSAEALALELRFIGLQEQLASFIMDEVVAENEIVPYFIFG